MHALALVAMLLAQSISQSNPDDWDVERIRIAYPKYSKVNHQVEKHLTVCGYAEQKSGDLVWLALFLCDEPEDSPMKPKEAELIAFRERKLVTRAKPLAPEDGEPSLKVVADPIPMSGYTHSVLVSTRTASMGNTSGHDTIYVFAEDRLTRGLEYIWGDGPNDSNAKLDAEGTGKAALTLTDAKGGKKTHHFQWDGSSFKPAVGETAGKIAIKTVYASSILHEQGLAADYYAPAKAIDGDDATAWAEAGRGFGKGESLTLEFDAPVKPSGLHILAGCGNSKYWPMNHRLRTIKVKYDDKTSERVELDDQREAQDLELHPKLETRKLTIEIADVYRGTKFDDSCISEVSVTGAQ